jgi:Rap1-interacting factor 1 N terminal
MLNGWGHVVMAFGSRLHRTPFLNSLLGLVEVNHTMNEPVISLPFFFMQGNFNSSRPGQRIAAFQAWRKLILVFSFEDHLFHQKRIKLILLPIMNSFKFEKSFAVRQASFETYLYLLYHLSNHPALPNLFETVIVPGLTIDRPEDRLYSVFIGAVGQFLLMQ